MNKYIIQDQTELEKRGALRKKDRYLRPKAKTQVQLSQPRSTNHSYLNIEIIPSQEESPYKYRFAGKKPGLKEITSIAIRKIKHQLRYNQKKLIIEGIDEPELQHQCNSLVLSKEYQDNQKRIATISSDKKTRIGQAFLASSPPKRIGVLPKNNSEKQDNKCELIKTILRRYNNPEELCQNPEVVGSPAISSVKLKRRELSKIEGMEGETFKFFGRRGCPPSRISKHFSTKQHNQKCKPSQQLFSQWQQIGPWGTQES